MKRQSIKAADTPQRLFFRFEDKRVLVLFVFGALLLVVLMAQRLTGLGDRKRVPAAGKAQYVVTPAIDGQAQDGTVRLHLTGKQPGSSTIDFRSPPISTAVASVFLHTPFPINRADVEELQLLPGIGPKLAMSIHARRMERGPFTTINDLESVSGLGAKKLRDLQPLLDFAH